MPATPMLILIVEDDASTRDVLARALAEHGMESAEAGTVGAALMRLDRDPVPAAVLLDLTLPDADGGTVLRRIRRDRLPVRVAVVTGHPDPDAVFEAMALAPDRIFRKPVDLAALVAWLRDGPA